MTKLKVLSVAAAVALVLPLAMPTASFAQFKGGHGGGFRAGGGGGFHGGPAGGFRAGPVGGAPVARFAAPPVAGVRGPAFAGGGWAGGPRHYRRGGGGFVPGLVAGAVIGGAIANSYAYSPNYSYAPGYYDDSYYYDDSAVAVAPDGGDAVAYCAQRYRSYDPASGTFLGYDGLRHPCP